jgi:hypothetical protein
MKLWIARVMAVALLSMGVIAGACGDDDDDGGNGDGTPDPITTRANQDPGDIDTESTPDPVDPNVTSSAGLDTLPDTPEIDSTANVTGEFVVAYTITELGLPMVGYQFDITWDNEAVEFVGIDHTEIGGLTLCPTTVQLAAQRILGACAQPQLQSTDATGQASLITFRCAAPGEANLHLRYQEGSFNTKIETVLPDVETSHSLDLSDATVVCS